MEKDQANFYEPGLPWIIVKELTKEIINEAVTQYIDADPDAYWVKLHHFANKIYMSVFNALQAQEIQDSKKVDLLVGLDTLKSEINKLDQIDESKKWDIIDSLNELYS